jgi:Predicted membrane protein
MEELFERFVGYAVLVIEAAAALLIVVGAIEALATLIAPRFERRSAVGVPRRAWVRFSVWLLLGLEFELGADIIRSAITPTWTDIGQLGAIAVIRTFLNYFLTRDLEKIAGEARSGEPARAREPPHATEMVE